MTDDRAQLRARAPARAPSRAKLKQRNLVIVDDTFPNVVSGFRVAEFTAYLEAFPGSVAMSAFSGEDGFLNSHRQFSEYFPKLRDRVMLMREDWSPAPNDFVFAYFLNTIFPYVDRLEQNGVPFAFQLSPGGGFSLGNPDSDRKLARVLASPQLVYVTVTQPNVQAYVRDRFGVPASLVSFIGPGVVWANDLPQIAASKNRYPHDKKFVDVGFVSMKYGGNLRSKGFDFFALMADRIAQHQTPIRFHVVGNYDPDDCSLGAAGPKTTFHGVLPHGELKALYRDLDVVIAPNVPFALGPGHIDGFPLGAVAEAGVAGVVPAITDPLKLNMHFTDGEDAILIERSIDKTMRNEAVAAAERVIELISSPADLQAFSERVATRFGQVFSFETQVAPRIELLRSALNGRLNAAGDWAEGWRSALIGERGYRSELEGRLADITAQLNDASQYILQKEGNIKELIEEVAKRDQIMAAIDEDAKRSREALGDELRRQIAALEETLRAGQSYLEVKERQALDQAEAIAARDRTVAQAQADILSLKQALQSAQGLIERKEEQLHLLITAQAKRDVHDKEAQDLVARDALSASVKIQALEAALQRSQSEAVHRQMTIAQKSDALAARDETIVRLQHEIEVLGATARAGQAALSRREAQLSSLVATLAERDAHYSAQEVERLESRRQLDTLSSALLHAQRIHERLEAERADALRQAEQLSSALIDAQKTKLKDERDLAALNAALEHARQGERDRAREIAALSAALDEALIGANAAREAAESDLRKALDHSSALEAAVADVRSALHHKDEEASALQTQVIALERDAEGRQASATASILNLQARLRELESRLAIREEEAKLFDQVLGEKISLLERFGQS